MNPPAQTTDYDGFLRTAFARADDLVDLADVVFFWRDVGKGPSEPLKPAPERDELCRTGLGTTRDLPKAAQGISRPGAETSWRDAGSRNVRAMIDGEGISHGG